ncbi:MAG: BMC domain-containing protein [Limnochordia bacterium]|nr:BMC domain-containing protein [Limnochordia bacterium]MDD2628569.1 BMC domain-containing protein [Limnochordia bacterium]MDD4518249.1 BMC domain-containing protein [Limnochordia bacterium]
MTRALGLVEVQNITRGLSVADTICKTAHIQLLTAMPVCPGKFIILFSGDVASIQAGLSAARKQAADAIVDDLLLARLHPSVFPALTASTNIDSLGALGVIETYTVASAILAADTAAKAADIGLIEIRLARGMGGKSFVYFTGDVASVTLAADKAASSSIEQGLLLEKTVIAAPDPQLWKQLL